MMNDVFAFVEDAEPLKTIKEHIKTITLLIQQVAECGSTPSSVPNAPRGARTKATSFPANGRG
ncbi:hypothetical protein OG21DRAFT_1515602 [Imleria badia]|nr:hypothetical protein OG21DRAFT_1515602 [Imleria badia]